MGMVIVWEPKRNSQRCESEEEAMKKIRRAVPDAQPDPTWAPSPDGVTSVKNVWRVHGGRTVKVASIVESAVPIPQPESKSCPPSDLPFSSDVNGG